MVGFFITTSFHTCQSKDELEFKKLLKETPHAITTKPNLFFGKGNEIRYYIVNPRDKSKVALIEEKAIIYAQEGQRVVVRVDSIHKANLIIRI